jgi:ABC transporter with metal-binding/Fe-S-binding domain ATP-binding protein
MKAKKLGVLFSGGKDSTLAAWIAKKEGYKLCCLISILSENPDSYMFHTPDIKQTKKQALAMNLPIIEQPTKGKKEDELKDLRESLIQARNLYKIEGIVTGAVESVYQSTRIRKLCYELKLECFNPLWLRNQIRLLEDLLENEFKAIIVGVAAFPLGKEWLGREINRKTIEELKTLQNKYKINPSGEGGEFETLVLDCPLFKKPLRIKDKQISGEKNSWRMEVELE